MAADNHTTIVGNLVDDPELRFTNNGIAVADSLPRATGSWSPGDSASAAGRPPKATSDRSPRSRPTRSAPRSSGPPPVAAVVPASAKMQIHAAAQPLHFVNLAVAVGAGFPASSSRSGRLGPLAAYLEGGGAETASSPGARPRSSPGAATSTRAPPSAASGTITGSLPTRLTSPGSAARASPARPSTATSSLRNSIGALVQTSTSRTSGHRRAATWFPAPAPRRPRPGSLL
jgi:hypothetical protein